MRRIYHGKTIEITIYPSGKDQSEVGMYVEMNRSGWNHSLFVPDVNLARVLGREMYYALVCEFFPNDFQSRPNTPEVSFVYKRIRRKSSSSRSRRTPQEMGIEAEPYDKSIVDSVEESSSNTDIGEARLRVERSVFQSIQAQDCNYESAEKAWWDIKYKLILLIVCLKHSLIKHPLDASKIQTNAELFKFWQTHSGMSDREMYYVEDGTLTQLAQVLVDGFGVSSLLYRLLSVSKPHSFLQEDMITLQNTTSVPELDGHTLIPLEQSRIIQVILVILLFGILLAGISSFMMENRKIMTILKNIQTKIDS